MSILRHGGRMKITPSEVPAAGLELREEFRAKEWGIETPDIHYDQPIVVNAQVSRLEKIVEIQAQATGSMRIMCARCLEEKVSPLEIEMQWEYESFSSEEVDIGEHIREEILLKYPLRFLCDEACKGLCPVCGNNLNRSNCACRSKTWESEHLQLRKKDIRRAHS